MWKQSVNRLHPNNPGKDRKRTKNPPVKEEKWVHVEELMAESTALGVKNQKRAQFNMTIVMRALQVEMPFLFTLGLDLIS